MSQLTPEYQILSKQLESLLQGESNMITNLSQFSALIFNGLNDLNWAGFYLVCGHELLQLGPFQGQVACTKIPFSRGVCGTVAQTKESIIVADVHQFVGHIACDANSQSELVVPLLVEGELIGVCDIDSPITNRFTLDDQLGIEKMVDILIEQTNFLL